MFSGWNLLTNAVFDFLCQQVIYSSILFVSVLLIHTFIKRTSLYWLYYIWFIVLARMLVPPDFSLPFSARNIIGCLSGFFFSPITIYSYDIDQAVSAHLFNNEVINTPSQVNFLKCCLLSLWLFGMVIMSTRYYRMLEWRNQILKSSEPVVDKYLLQRLAVWKNVYGIERNICLVASNKNVSPFTCGVRQPIICLPGSVVTANGYEACNAIIAHEMVHIRRFDDLWLQMERFLKIIYFFHPAVWYSCFQVSKYRERICDYEVLKKRTISDRCYINGLLKIIEISVGTTKQPAIQPSFGRQCKQVLERINLIKELSTMNRQRYKLAFIVTALAAFILLPMAATIPSR